MHKQPVYADAPVYTNGVEEEIFKIGFCLPAGPYVTDDDVEEGKILIIGTKCSPNRDKCDDTCPDNRQIFYNFVPISFFATKQYF